MIGIVTIQWNSSNHTIRFLDSIATDLGEDASLVIVDNGSSKDHIDKLKERILQTHRPVAGDSMTPITLIENEHNSGFARANNIGINYLAQRRVPWIWLLNNDCLVFDNTVCDLVKHLSQHPPGIVGMKILDTDHELETYGGYKFNKWTSRYHTLKQADEAQLQDPLTYVSGASMLIHHELFSKLGMLDDSVFLYFEEIDYCIRARKSGYPIKLLANVAVKHIGSGSSNTADLQLLKTYHETWSTLHFYSRHEKVLLPFVITLRTAIKIVRLILKSRNREIKQVLAATSDFLTGKNKDLTPMRITKTSYYQ